MQNHNCFHSRGGSNTAATPKMELFATIVNIFQLLINFVKRFILDVSGSPGCTSLWWLYVTKRSILDSSLDSSSCLDYQYTGFLFRNIQTQGNLVKEINLSCCSSPRSATHQICMRKMSEADIAFKCFKKR